MLLHKLALKFDPSTVVLDIAAIDYDIKFDTIFGMSRTSLEALDVLDPKEPLDTSLPFLPYPHLSGTVVVPSPHIHFSHTHRDAHWRFLIPFRLYLNLFLSLSSPKLSFIQGWRDYLSRTNLVLHPDEYLDLVHSLGFKAEDTALEILALMDRREKLALLSSARAMSTSRVSVSEPSEATSATVGASSAMSALPAVQRICEFPFCSETPTSH